MPSRWPGGVGRIQRKQPGAQRSYRSAPANRSRCQVRRCRSGLSPQSCRQVPPSPCLTRRRAVHPSPSQRPRLVQHNRRRNRIGHDHNADRRPRSGTHRCPRVRIARRVNRRRRHPSPSAPAVRRLAFAKVSVSGVVVAGGAGVPDVVELRERHLTGRRVQRDRHGGRPPNR